MASLSSETDSTDHLEFIETDDFDELAWQARTDRLERVYHAGMLGVCCTVLLTAALLRVRDDQLVEFRFLPGRPLPELCQMKVEFGLPCPGCGLTRCFVHTVHGNWSAATTANPAGLLLVILAVLQIPYRAWMLKYPGSVDWSTRYLVLILTVPPTLLVAQWLCRILWS